MRADMQKWLKEAADTITLTAQDLTVEDIKEFFSVLPNYPNITGLVIFTEKNRENDPVVYQAFIAHLAVNKTLKSLRVGVYSSRELTLLSLGLTGNQSIKSLYVVQTLIMTREAIKSSLFISEASFINFSAALATRGDLQTISLDMEFIHSGAMVLLEGLSKHTGLFRLDLAMQLSPWQIAGFVPSLSKIIANSQDNDAHNPHALREFKLRFALPPGWDLGADTKFHLAKLFSALTDSNLFEFDFSNNYVGDELAIILALALQGNKTLRSLNLSNNLLSSASVDLIVTALLDNKQSALKKLELRRNHMTRDRASILSRLGQTSLQELDLTGLEVDNIDCHSVANIVYTNNTMQVLRIGDYSSYSVVVDLDRMQMDETHASRNAPNKGVMVECILEALSENNTLHELALDGISSGVVSGYADSVEWKMPAVYSALRFTRLRKLSLNGCQFTEAHMYGIILSLTQNENLLSLSLANNKIGYEAAQAIAHLLMNNRTLRELDLSNCAISIDGLKAIIAALETNDTLYRLDLTGNQTVDSASKMYEVLASKNTALHEVRMDQNWLFNPQVDFGPLMKQKSKAPLLILKGLHIALAAARANNKPEVDSATQHVNSEELKQIEDKIGAKLFEFMGPDVVKPYDLATVTPKYRW
jgi:hypothetical protein